MKWFWIFFSIAKSEREINYNCQNPIFDFQCEAKKNHIKAMLIKDFCISYLVWLNVHKDDCHFFNLFFLWMMLTFASKQKFLPQQNMQVYIHF